MSLRTGRLGWVEGKRKCSTLFILDNHVIHRSRITQSDVEVFGGRILLLFSLPPYCPDDNRIERRVWRELHANVTRNHKCNSVACHLC